MRLIVLLALTHLLCVLIGLYLPQVWYSWRTWYARRHGPKGRYQVFVGETMKYDGDDLNAAKGVRYLNRSKGRKAYLLADGKLRN